MKTFEIYKANGEVKNADAVIMWLKNALRHVTNGSHTITIARKVAKRSLSQNRLMWLWFACIQQETGQPSMDIHDHYCYTLLGRDIINPTSGVIERVGGHTSTLSKEAFTDFLNQIQADAATEFGITLPSPEDIGFQDFVNEYNRYVNER